MIWFFDDFPLRAILLGELTVTSALTGLIWIIQVVHYPLFAAVGGENFKAFEREHCRRISFVVVPLMCGEVALCMLHLVESNGNLAAVVGALLLTIIWLSTFFIQVPLHNQLSERFSVDAHNALVRTNWIRTIAWTFRALLLFSLVNSAYA